jgi:hypothetical protein
MSTKKLRCFEYAGYRWEPAEGQLPRHIHCAFDTPNGYTFIVAGNTISVTSGDSLVQIAADRVKYYLLNEVLDDPAEAVRNAVIYANGFIHVLMGKQPGLRDAELSCMCVLVKDSKVYYAWVGQTCLYLYDGKNVVPLSRDIYQEDNTNTSLKSWQISFLGQNQMISPGICQQPLVPIDDDTLLMGTSGFCVYFEEKNTKNTLSDSMPSHTKAARLLKKAVDDEIPAACQIIKFYNIKEDIRTFIPGEHPSNVKTTSVELPVVSWIKSQLPYRLIAYAISVIVLSYMVYDLFLIDPRPPSRIEVAAEPQEGELETVNGGLSERGVGFEGQDATRSTSAVSQAPEVSGQAPAGSRPVDVVPEDILYTVRQGDNWGRIYREFEVCSWFIRNHPPNRGKFDASNNPIAGSQLAIPVVYSAKQSLNPTYFQEFTISRVGGSCQNVNNQFLRSFEQKFRASRQE